MGASVHLIKLSVGPQHLGQLEAWQQARLAEKVRRGEPAVLVHVTRNTPKRGAELLDGGSIYWVIKGWIVARQPLLELRLLEIDGVPHCGLVLAPDMIRVVPRRHRPFQGWRYLAPEAAPADLTSSAIDPNMPEDMQRELAELGLL